MLPIIAVGLWGFVSLVIGTIYPAAIQQFRVGPNEFARKRPTSTATSTRRATRSASTWSRPSNFDFTTFAGRRTTPDAVVDSNRGTIDNARLWDPDVIDDTYRDAAEPADLLPDR